MLSAVCRIFSFCKLGCIHQQHELHAEQGDGRRGGEEAYGAAMAFDVGDECPRVKRNARSSRGRQPGEKQCIEPEQYLREHGDAV
jgi:hypothetical protein